MTGYTYRPPDVAALRQEHSQCLGQARDARLQGKRSLAALCLTAARVLRAQMSPRPKDMRAGGQFDLVFDSD